MKKISLEKNDLISLLIMVFIGTIFIMVGLIIVGNKPEVYNDIVLEAVALYGSNMSGELSVFWSILFLGIPILLLIDYFLVKKNKFKSLKEIPLYLGMQVVLGVANFIWFLINGNFYIFLVFLSFMLFINQLINPKKQMENIILPIIIFYFLLTLCTIFNYIGIDKIFNHIGNENIFNTSILLIATLILDVLISLFSKSKNCLNKIIMFMQIIIPCLFLIYRCERYIYKNKIIYISQPLFSKIFFSVIIIVMIIYVVYYIYKNFKNIESLPPSKIVLLTTVLTIFAFNSVPCNTELKAPTDFHHTGESVISYQQIMANGQKPYDEYSPVSGLFPIFTGFILELLGGNFSSFYLAHSIFMICFSLIIMYLLSKHLSNEDCLLVSIFFALPNYDRIVLILPSLLILLLPKIIKNKNLWLKLWLWLCFIGGIYYPTFGMAVLLGTLPFALVQIYQLIKSGELKSKLKSFKFYLGWIICLIPIIYFIPMLIRMAKHILAYSSQTILADGIAVFGQEVPDYFMPYLNSIEFVRTLMYYSIRYLIPLIFIWLFIVLLKKLFKERKLKELIKSPEFLIITSTLFVLLFSYSSTLIRNDLDAIIARTKNVLVLVGLIYLYLFIKKYMNKNILSYSLIGFLFGIALIFSLSGIKYTESRFLYAYNIDDEYEVIDDELKSMYPRLGNGFIEKNKIAILDDAKRAYELLKYDPNLKFYAWCLLGTYYTLDIKTVGQPSVFAMKGYQTSKEVIDAIKKYKPVVGLQLSSSYSNYYLYKWLLTTDGYVYDNNYRAFLPKELFEKIYGSNKKPDKKIDTPLYTTKLEREANSLGKSINSLKEILNYKNNKYEVTKKGKNKYQIKFDKKVNGETNDFLYIKFDTEKINKKILKNQSFLQRLLKQVYSDKSYVNVNWNEEDIDKNTITSILGNGELLIPLGSNVNWLLDNHDSIYITIDNINENVKIENLCFYELKNR